MVAQSVEQFVRQRAGNRCEYCLLPQEGTPFLFQIDHIYAKQHVVDDSIGNLALACHWCNLCKGPNLAGLDPSTRQVIPLFNPRTQTWAEHFKFEAARIVALTPSGAVTIHVLQLNERSRLAVRSSLLRNNQFFEPRRGS